MKPQWIRVGFVVKFVDSDGVDRFGEVLEVQPWRVQVRTYAPDLTPLETIPHKRFAYLDVDPNQVQPCRDGAKYREYWKQLKAADAADHSMNKRRRNFNR